jgi:hypothetical protein
MGEHLKRTSIDTVPWWVWVGIINFHLILATTVSDNDLPLKKYLVSPYNLAMEMNLGVWWASMMLALSGLLFLEHGIKNTAGLRWNWVVLSLLFLGLSLDELGSIHERVGGWENLLPFIVFGGLFLMSALARVITRPETRGAGLFVAVAFILFGAVVAMEYLEHAVQWPAWSLGPRAGLEEGVEVGGTMLLIAAALRLRVKSAQGIWAIIPDLAGLRRLPEFALALLLAHSIASMVLPRFIDVTVKGNPLVWAPVFLLFTGALLFVKDLGQGAGLRKMGGAAFLALCSMSLVYNLGKLLPSALGIDAGLAFPVACILIAGVYTLTNPILRNLVLLVATAVFLLLLQWARVDPLGSGMSMGGFALALTALFVPRFWLRHTEPEKVEGGIAARQINV